ncbi:alpha/beta fold hydrolase [Modestobacter lapidis]|nr:alpha/beta fold hydrolase [Modestobacter lapidis]
MTRFVLVHGAFAGGWCWEPLAAELRRRGHTVSAPDLPGSGADTTPLPDVTLDAYAERVCSVLAESPDEAVLVGHSMGGVVITQTAARCPERIARLVYVAAFLPRDEQSLVGLTDLPEGAGDGVQANITVSGEPPVADMSAEACRGVFYGTTSAERTEWALERQGRQPVLPFVTPVSLGGGVDDIPRSYVVCTEDRAIPPALQRRMIADNPCTDVLELPADHSPYLSATTELADFLEH